MYLYSLFPRRVCLLSLSITIILLICSAVFTQGSKYERTFPSQENPKIAISNASIVKITGWSKHEVFVRAEVLADTIQSEEVAIKDDKNKLDIDCRPSKPDRKIFLMINAPPKA